MRYLGIVTCHIESDVCPLATPTQAFGWSAEAHGCSAKEMTVTSVLLIAQALFWVVDHGNRPCNLEVMGKSSHCVWTRSRTVAKPYQFVCDCPFHDDWKSPDTSQKADTVSANLSMSWAQSSRRQFCLSVEPARMKPVRDVKLPLALSIMKYTSCLVSCPKVWRKRSWRPTFREQIKRRTQLVGCARSLRELCISVAQAVLVIMSSGCRAMVRTQIQVQLRTKVRRVWPWATMVVLPILQPCQEGATPPPSQWFTAAISGLRSEIAKTRSVASQAVEATASLTSTVGQLKRKKIDCPTPAVLKKPDLARQHAFKERVLMSVDAALESLPDDEEEVRSLLIQSKSDLDTRQKHLRIADKFDWETVEVYTDGLVGDNCTDDTVATCTVGKPPRVGGMPDETKQLASESEFPSPSSTRASTFNGTDEELKEELFSAEKRKGKKRRSSLFANEHSFGEFEPDFNLMNFCSREELQDPTGHVGDRHLREKETTSEKKLNSFKGEWSKWGGNVSKQLGGGKEERVCS